MSPDQPNTTPHRNGNAAPGGAGEARVSAGRAFVSDARLAFGVLNEARYPVLRYVFGVSRAEVNLLTFVLAVGAANATYEALRRFIRHPWPLDRADTAFAGFFVREIGFGIAGPKAREIDRYGALIAVAAIGSVTLPGARRALHAMRVAEQRVGQQRMRVYGAAQPEERRRPPASSPRADRSGVRRYRALLTPTALRASRGRP